MVLCYNIRLVKRGSPQTAARSNKFILIYCSFDWLHGCKYSAVKYIVWVTECLFQAPPCRPVGSELPCHSQLFIRLHIHSLSITVWPPGPVTSLYVYYGVPPSRGGWLTFSERTEVGLARAFFSNRGSRGGGFSIHTLIMSQLPDISETITVGGYFLSKNLNRQVESSARFSASSSRVISEVFIRRSPTRSTFNQIRSL